MSEIKLEKLIGRLLIEKKLTVSTAESCTGGLVSSRLTDVSGCSAYIKFNAVTYSNEAKIKQLGVSPESIKECGAVSEIVAKQMAQGIRKLSETDIGVGITGIAGPTGGTPQKPVGLVYIAINNEEQTEVHKVKMTPELLRTEIKYRASQYALEFLREFINRFY